MKRDMDLIRNILLYIEKEYKGELLVIEKFENYDINVFLYHCELLLDSNLIKGKIDRPISGGGMFECKGLTWNGQEYLANIKNDKVWKKVKKTILEKGIDFTLDIIAQLSAKYTKELLQLN